MIIYLNPSSGTYSTVRGDGYFIPAEVSDGCVLDEIAHEVCGKLGLDKSVLFNPSRKAEVIKARRLFIYKARRMGLLFVVIANYLHVNHPTVIHHYYRVLELIEIYPDEWNGLI